jgi:hypothetical protein
MLKSSPERGRQKNGRHHDSVVAIDVFPSYTKLILGLVLSGERRLKLVQCRCQAISGGFLF